MTNIRLITKNELKGLGCHLALAPSDDWIMVGAEVDGKIVGAAWGVIGGRIGIVYGIYIAEDKRREYLGFTLCFRLLQVMQKENVEYVYGVISKSEIDSQLSHLYSEMGCVLTQAVFGVTGRLSDVLTNMEQKYVSRRI